MAPAHAQIASYTLAPPTTPGYGYGCTLSRSAATTVGITACTTADDTTSVIIPSTVAYTKTLGAWTVGTGNGCLDTGALGATKFIYLYQIQRSDTAVVDYLCTITFGTPTLPTGYDRKRFIGAVPMDGAGNILAFTQINNQVILSASVLELNNVFVNATTAVSLTLNGVPSGYKVLGQFRATMFNGGGVNNIRYSSFDEADVTAANGYATIASTTASVNGAAQFNLMTNTASAIRYRILLATGTNHTLTTAGWIDPQIAWQH